jgi:predicted nucleotidyltransferase
MNAPASLEALSATHQVLALYLFGSRADEGLRILSGHPAQHDGADLDVGVVFHGRTINPLELASLQVKLEDLFSPLRVDLVPLHRVDPLFQFAAISGHRVASPDSTRADEYELEVMRQASELLPIQRRLEIDLFGVTNR